MAETNIIVTNMDNFLATQPIVYDRERIIATTATDFLRIVGTYQNFKNNEKHLRQSIIKWLRKKTLGDLGLPSIFIGYCKIYNRQDLLTEVSGHDLNRMVPCGHAHEILTNFLRFERNIGIEKKYGRHLADIEKDHHDVSKKKKKARNDHTVKSSQSAEVIVEELEKIESLQLNHEDTRGLHELRCAEEFYKIRSDERKKAHTYCGRVISAAFNLLTLEEIVKIYVNKKLQTNPNVFDGLLNEARLSQIKDELLDPTNKALDGIDDSIIARWNNIFAPSDFGPFIVNALKAITVLPTVNQSNIMNNIHSTDNGDEQGNGMDSEEFDEEDDEESMSDISVNKIMQHLEEREPVNPDLGVDRDESNHDHTITNSYFYLIRPGEMNFVKIGVTKDSKIQVCGRYRPYYGPIENHQIAHLAISDSDLRTKEARKMFELIFIMLVSFIFISFLLSKTSFLFLSDSSVAI